MPGADGGWRHGAGVAVAAPQYRRTIEGWQLVGNHAGAMPMPEQSDAWDALTSAEQDRIGALFDATLPDEEPLDVLPGERAYDAWKADRMPA